MRLAQQSRPSVDEADTGRPSVGFALDFYNFRFHQTSGRMGRPTSRPSVRNYGLSPVAGRVTLVLSRGRRRLHGHGDPPSALPRISISYTRVTRVLRATRRPENLSYPLASLKRNGRSRISRTSFRESTGYVRSSRVHAHGNIFGKCFEPQDAAGSRSQTMQDAADFTQERGLAPR
jgi:hypothetical protein